MVFAVTHIILTVVLLNIYRSHFSKHRYFTMQTLLVGVVASLFPDLDLIITKVLNFFGYILPSLEHGNLMHTPIFWLIFLIPAFFLFKKGKHKKAAYFIAITFASLFHIFLDFILGGGGNNGFMIFWPFLSERYQVRLLGYSPNSNLFVLDAIILIVWLLYEIKKRKLRNFF